MYGSSTIASNVSEEAVQRITAPATGCIILPVKQPQARYAETKFEIVPQMWLGIIFENLIISFWSGWQRAAMMADRYLRRK